MSQSARKQLLKTRIKKEGEIREDVGGYRLLIEGDTSNNQCVLGDRAFYFFISMCVSVINSTSCTDVEQRAG